MAKGNRDVELVIRAKNEASKALDAVSSALETLTKSQADVSKGATRTGTLLSQLGAELGKLNQQIGGMSTLDKFANSMEKASGSVARLEGSIADLNKEQAQLANDIKASETAVAGFQAKAEQLRQTLTKQSAATKKSEADLAALNAEIKSGESSLTKSVANSRGYEAQLQKLGAKLAGTQQRHRDLTIEILKAENPTKRLISAFESADAALQKQTTALRKAQSAYASNRAATAEIEASLTTLRAAQEQTAAAFTKAQSAQRSTSATLKQLGTASKEAERNLRDLRDTATGNAAALERQDAALKKSKVELAAVEQAAREADVALDKIGGTIRQRLLRSLADSQSELQRYRQTWEQATAAVRAAVANGATAAAPTPELTKNIAVAQASKQAYMELQVAIQQMRSAVREAGTDVTKLSTAQQTFVSALDRVENKTKAVSAAQQQLTSAANAAGNAVVNTAARQAAGYTQVGSSVTRMAASVRQAAGAMDDLEVRGRRALSWGQRLNSELIALGTSFVGVYAAIEQLKGVARTFQDLEAVGSRLGVAFDGSAERIDAEMRFLQQQAERLGIDIRVLATEYSKLAIATKNSSLEGEATRRIFLSLAEAFRVNRLTSHQMELAFNAVTQMVNKGAVSMEELRQQLGERLAGAFNLAAQASGYTTKEFSKLVAEGKILTDEFLPKLADQLDQTFGPQLEKSLDSYTTELGQFQNELTKAQLRVAESGFIDGLRDALKTLTTYFRSAEGQQFFENLGAAAGGLVRVLAQIPQYFDLIAIAASLFVGRKLTGYITDLGSRTAQWATALKPLPAAIQQVNTAGNAFAGVGGVYNTTVLNATQNTRSLGQSAVLMAGQLRSAASSFTLARAGALGLNAAVTTLRAGFALLGGLPGIIVTGLTVAFTYWLTSTDDVIAATDEHQRQMNALIESYRQAKDGAGDWAKEVQGVSLAGAEQNLNQLRTQLQSQVKELTDSIGGAIQIGTSYSGSGLFGNTGKQVKELSDQLRSGEITVKQFAESLDDLLRTAPVSEELRGLIQRTSELAQEAITSEKAVAQQANVVEALGGQVEGVSPKVRELAKSFEELANGSTGGGEAIQKNLVDPAEKFGEALDQLRSKVPSLSDELKLLEQIKEIDEILKTAEAIDGLDKTSEAYQRLVSTAKQAASELRAAFDEKQFKDAFNLLSQGGTAIEQSANLIRKREGFRETPYWDVNAFRVGFGSDTVTLADGSVKKVVEGMRVSVADANRDLERRIGEFQGVIRNQIGGERFAQFEPAQQAVLTSIAYNYGSLPERILDAVRTGSSEEIANAIRGLAGDNGGVNASRRNEEAYLFQSGQQISAEANAKFVQDELKAAEQLQERADQYRERLAETLALKQQEAELGKQRTLQEEINLAIAKEEVNAKKAGTELTDAEKQKITEITTVLYQRKAAEDAITQAKKEQEAADQRINLLTQTRRDLLEQMRFALDTGNNEGYENLRTQLMGVEEQLRSAIDAQIAFWEAAQGGPDGEKATAAIASLNVLKNSLGQVNQTAILTAFNVGKAFGDQLIAGANNFLAKIRETGDVLGSAKEAFLQFASDFLLQIAQMILKQAILNALTAAFGGGAPGGFGAGVLSAFGVGVQHNGGITGSGNRQRSVSPALFANAVRYHSGGVAGLKPDEVPTILQKGEEVLTADDPRHRNNGGGASQTEVKIVNAIDAGSFVSAGVEDVQGQKAILNFMRANSGAVKSALGVG